MRSLMVRFLFDPPNRFLFDPLQPIANHIPGSIIALTGELSTSPNRLADGSAGCLSGGLVGPPTRLQFARRTFSARKLTTQRRASPARRMRFLIACLPASINWRTRVVPRPMRSVAAFSARRAAQAADCSTMRLTSRRARLTAIRARSAMPEASLLAVSPTRQISRRTPCRALQGRLLQPAAQSDALRATACAPVWPPLAAAAAQAGCAP